jgi:hypothetical protein
MKLDGECPSCFGFKLKEEKVGIVYHENEEHSNISPGNLIGNGFSFYKITVKDPANVSFSDEEQEWPSKFVGKEPNLLGTLKNYEHFVCSKTKLLATRNPYARLREILTFKSQTFVSKSITEAFMSKRYRELKRIKNKGKSTRSKSDKVFPVKQEIRKFNNYSIADVKEIKKPLEKLHEEDKKRIKKLPAFKSFSSLNRLNLLHHSFISTKS